MARAVQVLFLMSICVSGALVGMIAARVGLPLAVDTAAPVVVVIGLAVFRVSAGDRIIAFVLDAIARRRTIPLITAVSLATPGGLYWIFAHSFDLTVLVKNATGLVYKQSPLSPETHLDIRDHDSVVVRSFSRAGWCLYVGGHRERWQVTGNEASCPFYKGDNLFIGLRAAPPSYHLGVPDAQANDQANQLCDSDDVHPPRQPYSLQQRAVSWNELLLINESKTTEWVDGRGLNLEDKATLQQPAIGVPFRIAYEYCRFIGARLPTEEEWAYAIRGPNHACDFNQRHDARVSVNSSVQEWTDGDWIYGCGDETPEETMILDRREYQIVRGEIPGQHAACPLADRLRLMVFDLENMDYDHRDVAHLDYAHKIERVGFRCARDGLHEGP